MNSTDVAASHVAISTNGLFVTMSYFISVLGAFTTFSFMLEMRHIKSYLMRAIYLFCSSVALGGCSIFSMHFVGTVCFAMTLVNPTSGTRIPLGVKYNVGLTIASAIAAIVLCFFGLLATSLQLFIPKFTMLTRYIRIPSPTVEEDITEEQGEKKVTKFAKVIPTKEALLDSVFGNEKKPHFIQIAVGALFTTSGIVVMHYVGMMSTEIEHVMTMYNPGVIVASIITGYLVSCVALWLAMNLANEYQQAISALVSGLAVCGTHYIGMASANYTPVMSSKDSTKKVFSNYEVTLIVTLATTITCFVMLMISSISNRKRLLLIAKTTLQLDEEKKKVQVSQTSVDKLSTLVKRIAFEEHQTRRVIDLVSDGVCIVSKEGQILKYNDAFEKLCSLNPQLPPESLTQCLELNVAELFQSKVNSFHLSLQNKIRGATEIEITSSVEECDTTFCILVLKVQSQAETLSRKRQNTLHDSDGNNMTKGTLVSQLDALLETEDSVTEFRQFVKKELCDENIEFVFLVKEYKRCGDVLKRVDIQASLLNTYCKKGSPKQLNLPDSLLDQATNEISSGYGQPDLFDTLEVKVKEILLDSYFRYLQLKNGKELTREQSILSHETLEEMACK